MPIKCKKKLSRGVAIIIINVYDYPYLNVYNDFTSESNRLRKSESRVECKLFQEIKKSVEILENNGGR